MRRCGHSSGYRERCRRVTTSPGASVEPGGVLEGKGRFARALRLPPARRRPKQSAGMLIVAANLDGQATPQLRGLNHRRRCLERARGVRAEGDSPMAVTPPSPPRRAQCAPRESPSPLTGTLAASGAARLVTCSDAQAVEAAWATTHAQAWHIATWSSMRGDAIRGLDTSEDPLVDRGTPGVTCSWKTHQMRGVTSLDPDRHLTARLGEVSRLRRDAAAPIDVRGQW